MANFNLVSGRKPAVSISGRIVAELDGRAGICRVIIRVVVSRVRRQGFPRPRFSKVPMQGFAACRLAARRAFGQCARVPCRHTQTLSLDGATRNGTINGMLLGRIDTARQRQMAKLESPSDADNDNLLCFNGLTFCTEARRAILTLCRLLLSLTRIPSPFTIRD